MPPFYGNLQNWFRGCIDDHFGSLEKDDEKLQYIQSLSSMKGLREFCDETVDLIADTWNNKSFVEALMNSVDWDELFDEVSDDMEEEKKALLDKGVCVDSCECENNSDNWNHCAECSSKFCDLGPNAEEGWTYDDDKEIWLCPDCGEESDD